MQEVSLRDGETFIKLGQLLKKANMVSSGVEAKMVILDGQVTLNGNVEVQRGKKIYPGDVVTFQGESVKVAE
jgi:ribosome-associated protein